MATDCDTSRRSGAAVDSLLSMGAERENFPMSNRPGCLSILVTNLSLSFYAIPVRQFMWK